MRLLEPDVRELGERAIEMSRSYSIWWALVKVEHRSAYAQAFSEHADFFDATEHAHFLSLTVISHQLFDTRSDVLSIPTVLDRIRPHRAAMVAQIEARLRPHQDIYDRLSLVRSKVYAHRDLEVSPESVFRVASLTAEAVGACVDVVRDTLDALFTEFVPGHSELEYCTEALRRADWAFEDTIRTLAALSNNELQRAGAR